MIFERLTLHNFQRYGGSNTIQFPDPDESSLVVVLAPNNAGKTTILRAIEFLFYGSLCGESAETAWKLITDIVRDATETGTEASAWVDARLRFPDDQVLTVRRQITARHPAETRWVAESPKLLWKKTDSPNEKFVVDDGRHQVKIDNAVPQDLFSWFYFHGEPAKGRMGHGASAGVLRWTIERGLSWPVSQNSGQNSQESTPAGHF